MRRCGSSAARPASGRGIAMALAAALSIGVPAAAQIPAAIDVDRLEREIPGLMDAAGIPGLSIAVIAGGEIAWSGAFGVADAATGRPVTPRTVFQAASLTKQLFALTALRLADRGVFDLDTPLAEYLPYSRLEHEPRARSITARHVLSHSTGLPNWGGERLQLGFDPGEGFNYSGEGYVYLQKTLERLTGEDLATLVDREVLAPLGLADSWMAWRADFEDRAAARHDEWGRSDGVVRGDAQNAAASLLTTARDYARFVVHLIEGGGLDPATWAAATEPNVRVASRPQIDTEGKLYWGLGWGLQTGPAGPTLWQWGHNDGFRALLLAWPDRGDGIVYFANGDGGLSIAYAIVDLLAEAAGWPAADHWALAWLDYERYDAPERLARRAIVETFVEDGLEEGLARYEALRAERTPGEAELLGTRAGAALQGLGHLDGALALLRRNAEDHPESSRARAAVAGALLEARRYEEADAAYDQVLARDPSNEDAARARGWIEPVLAAIANPPEVPQEQLAGYAGDYGPRHVTLESGRLFYRRDDNPPTALTPIAADTFILESTGTFRIRFAEDRDGTVTKIVGLYADGTEDETSRDP